MKLPTLNFPMFPTLADIRAASVRIGPFVHRTPVLTSRTWNELTGAELYFKCENFQKIGAFKARGAHNVAAYGAEPAGADAAQRSLRSGQLQGAGIVNTIADGLRTPLGERNFSVISQMVSDIATVSDPEIIEAMQLVWQILKIIIEPSCAVPVAALLHQRLPLKGKRIGVILTGGNVDLRALPWL